MSSTPANVIVHTPILRPEYSEDFRCIGPACEDTCCAGWTIAVDEAACGKYATVPAGALRSLLDANVLVQPPNADGTPPKAFAKVRMTADNACPFLNAERLCQIQVEQGEDYLSNVCRTYPRVGYKIDGLEERALSLSCPEAARMVLLSEDLLATKLEGHYQMSWPVAEERRAGEALDLTGYFWPVREFVLKLVTNRSYDLWQRLFVAGVFIHQLDGLGHSADGGGQGEPDGGGVDRRFSALLGGFRGAVESGGLRVEMEMIPSDLRLQLDMVLLMAGLQLPRTHIGARFLETVEMFTKGIGNAEGVTMEQLIRGYKRAYRRYYEPFFLKHARMLENLLVNQIFKLLFPYGPNFGRADWKPEMERQFALLVAQFALIKGLLIGVAGFRRESFAIEDVVFTVQSASKHFEHHPAFLEEAYALLVSKKLDNARGLTMLVRN